MNIPKMNIKIPPPEKYKINILPYYLTEPFKSELHKNQIVNESTRFRCRICLSSATRKGFLGLFGKRTCDNKKCENSKNRFYKL